MAEDKRILTAAGENNSLAVAGEGRNLLIAEDETSLLTTAWRIKSLGYMPIYWGFLS